jgi:hypothetical protein
VKHIPQLECNVVEKEWTPLCLLTVSRVSTDDSVWRWCVKPMWFRQMEIRQPRQ